MKNKKNDEGRSKLLSKSLVRAVNPDSVLGMVMLGLHSGNYKSLGKRVHLVKTDNIVKYCETCKTTWEYSRGNTNIASNYILHYTCIPTIGKKRKTCPDCLFKEKAEEAKKKNG